MRFAVQAALVLLAPVAVALGPVTGAALADDPPPAAEPTADQKATEWLTDLKGRMTRLDETESRASIQKLAAIWKDAQVAEATKKAVPDLLSRFARNGDHVTVAVAAIDALAELDPETGAREIRDVLEKELKAKKPAVDVYGACLRGLKKLADPSKATISLLVDLLKRKENDVIGKAAEAMAGYKEADGKVRRELMEEVLKAGESVFQAAQDGKDSTAKKKWADIRTGVMSALNTLSGQSFNDPVAARRWYNDHKKDSKVWG